MRRSSMALFGVLALVACRRAPFDPSLDAPPPSDEAPVSSPAADAAAPPRDARAPEEPRDGAAPSEPAQDAAMASEPDAGEPSGPQADASSCGDVERDVYNCGSCGHVCPGAGLDEASCAWGECKLAGCTLASHGPHTYAYCTDPKTWTGARARCQELSLDLVDIADLEERQFVESMVVASLVWIGLNDRGNEGDYYFVTPGGDETGRKVWTAGHAEGTAYVPWATTQPDSFGDEDCVRFDPGAVGGYQDLSCELIWGFVCESG